MNIKFYCPHWGSVAIPFKQFALDVKHAGYNGVEMSLPYDESDKQAILSCLKDFELEYIAQHWETIDVNFEAHKENYRKRLRNLASASPLFINSQTGKDYYPEDYNITLIDIARQITEETGIAIVHETHRGKFSFAAHTTLNYLQKIRDLRLTLDVSHWFNVAETFLEDQQEALNAAIIRTDHIHSRVGHTEGPQIPNPMDAEWKGVLEQHLSIWDQVIENAKAQKRDDFTITAEFGPFPYMVKLPFSGDPIANQWEINKYMMDLLKTRYKLNLEP